MNRKDITKMLGRTLIQSKFSGMGKYWASEVSIDPFTATGKGGRVDFMQFIPENQYSISGLEKGIFVCYEVKSCREDVFSGNGLNFYGEKNYIVTTMQCYKDILPDLNKQIQSRKETLEFMWRYQSCEIRLMSLKPLHRFQRISSGS